MILQTEFPLEMLLTDRREIFLSFTLNISIMSTKKYCNAWFDRKGWVYYQSGKKHGWFQVIHSCHRASWKKNIRSGQLVISQEPRAHKHDWNDRATRYNPDIFNSFPKVKYPAAPSCQWCPQVPRYMDSCKNHKQPNNVDMSSKTSPATYLKKKIMSGVITSKGTVNFILIWTHWH